MIVGGLDCQTMEPAETRRANGLPLRPSNLLALVIPKRTAGQMLQMWLGHVTMSCAAQRQRITSHSSILAVEATEINDIYDFPGGHDWHDRASRRRLPYLRDPKQLQ